LPKQKNSGYYQPFFQIQQRFLSNTTFQNYDDIIERSCQAWNEILSEDGFIKNLCSREWSFLV
jgi:hypothetical protein